MKKLLSIILVSLMLLASFSCAAPDIADEKILSSNDVQKLNTEDTYQSTATIYATEGTYVRGGTYKDTIPSQLPQQDYYFIKFDSPENTFRTPVLKFDISDFNIPENTRSINLVVDFATVSPVHDNFAGHELKINAYTTTNDWDPATVTFASLPRLSEDDIIGSEYIIKGEVYIDITEYVLECIENDVDTFSIRLAANVQSRSEMRINMLGSVNGPRIVAKETEAHEFYQPKLLADEAANKALWDYAKEIYNSWEVRYNEILAKGDYPSTTINSNPDDYTIKTNAKMQDQGNKSYTFDTRLLSTLSGFNASDYNFELDKYGGIISDERYEATGYFYTKKIGDRWWVIDPLGNPCYITGINHLVYAYKNSTYQTAAMKRLFGSEQKWALSTTRWLQKDLGFNVGLASNSTGANVILDVETGLSTTIRITNRT